MGPIVFLACFGWTSGEPEPYLRAVDDEAGGRVLQIASRTLVSPEKDGPSVTLLGVSHLGNKAYYKEIQKKLDTADLVLFEGVGFGEKGPQKNEGSSNAVSEMQLSLARSMGLVFQLEAIRYDRAHFRNSDISSEALMTRLKGGPLKAGRSEEKEAQKTTGKQARKQGIDGGSFWKFFRFEFPWKSFEFSWERPQVPGFDEIGHRGNLGSHRRRRNPLGGIIGAGNGKVHEGLAGGPEHHCLPRSPQSPKG